MVVKQDVLILVIIAKTVNVNNSKYSVYILYNNLPPVECHLAIHSCISHLPGVARGAALKIRNPICYKQIINFEGSGPRDHQIRNPLEK